MRSPEQILSSLPLRLRLTLAYTGVMAFVLAIVCVFLFLHTRAGIDQGIDDALALRAHDVAAVARIGDPAALLRTPALPAGQIGDVVQVVDAEGRIVAATPSARRALLSAGELRDAQRRRIVRDRGESLRVLAQPVGAARRVVVVGADLPQREHALDVLTGALLIGGPLALALAALAGYALASGALRPVEAMRRRAATISAADPDARLPLPEARDEIRRLGETLNAMLARMAHARRRERAFVADASHELRTPLAILKGELELAAAGDPDRAELRRVVASATEETDRLVALAEELLALARLDDDSLTIRPGPLAVHEVMETVAASFAVAAPRRAARSWSRAGRRSSPTPTPSACARRSATSWRTPCATAQAPCASVPAPPTAASRCTCATRATASRPASSPARSIASRAATASAGPARAWGWRSWRRSPPRTAAAPTPATVPTGGADVWIALPSPDGEPFTAVS